ncbi:receptor-type tyrosine-protein phosphatase F-like isoform X2 [Bolinopsis microptera]|uniref:receptor-type tyrosine-protein phosphatase F-like isoform X2 n=1 Tax=Bolinopsis microptera TaxID=2820187 RepID=UPI00307A4837
MIWCFVFSLLQPASSNIPEGYRGSNTTNPACYFVSPVKQVVAEGSYVALNIAVGGDPHPGSDSIEWTKMSGGALPAPSNGKLNVIFKGIKEVNEGTYRVFVSTSAGIKIIDTVIDIRPRRMSVDVIPKSSNPLQGTTKEIQCSAGMIDSKYSWLRNGQEIGDINDRYSMFTQADKSTLTIQNIAMRDEGTYECRAWNTNSAGNNTATVIVQDAGNIPLVDISPVNSTLFMQDSFDVKFRCSVPDDPRAQFLFWTKDGKQIYSDRDSRREYEPSRSKLNIYNIRVEDTGKYTCVATLHNGIRVEGSTFLTVKPAITVVCTEAQFLDVGSDTTISCSISGDTAPSVFMYWLKGSSPIASSGKYRISDDKSSLRISNIQEEDGGMYTVVIQTSLGTKHESSSITVIMDPVILESPASLTVATGSDVSLTCVYSGTPKPYFFWNKDDEAVEVESDERITTAEEYVDKNVRRDILSIKRVNKVDAGAYYGFALNMGNADATGTGVQSGQADLRVIDPPIINVPPRNISLTQGKSTSIKCGYTGDQPLTIEWLYEGRALTNSADNRIELDSAAGTIKFATIRSSDTGQYVCRVQNEVGVVTATAKLTVQVPPEITQGPEAVNVSRGSAVRLTCVARIGYPAPTMSWRKNGNLIARVPMQTTSDILEIENINTTDLYTCIASNQAGQDTAEARVAVKTVPEKPGLPIAVEKDKTSIKLQWEPGHDGYTPIRQYTVMYRLEGEDWKTYPTTAITNELRVTNLQPFKSYTFKVFSANEIGSSAASIEARISTEQGRPSAPLNLQVRALSSTSAEVSWEQPLDTQGSLFGYYLDYQIRNSPSSEWEKVSTASRTYTLSGLAKYTEYTVRVQARNTQGAGDSSQMVFFKTLEDSPGPPLSLSVGAVSSSSLRVNWVQPTFPNGIIQRYKVYYQCTSGDCPLSHRTVETRSENPTYLLTDLYKYTEYKLYVTAITGAGEGLSSTNAVGTSLEDRPEAPPQLVHGTAVSSTSITITWAPPDRRAQCGVITKYRILYKTLYASPESPIEVSTISEYTLTNLTKYTIYSIQIEAGTIKGYGPPSEPVQVRTGEDIPEGRPVDLETNAFSSTEINVAWRAPPSSSVHGRITGYRVEYGLTGKRKKAVTTGPETLHKRLEDLDKGKNYHICVKVGNSKGWGPCSDQERYTSPDLPSAPFIFDLEPGQRNIEVRWREPERPNGEIIGYKIVHTPPGANFTVGADTLSYNIRGLEPWTQYHVKVSAQTSAGFGNYSELQNPVRTLEGKPESSITDLSGRPLNTTTIELTWRNPLRPNGQITKYAFSFIPHDGGEIYDTHMVNADGARVSKDLFKTQYPGLKENTLYQVKGMAFNRVGESGWCEAVSVRTTIGAPYDVVVMATSESTLYISWESPQGIEVEKDYVYVLETTGSLKGRDELVNEHEITDKSTFGVVEGAVAGTQYSVRVRARLTGGEGPWSDPATLTLSDTIEPLIDTSSVAPNTSVPGALLLNLAEIIPEVFQRPGIRVSVVLLTLDNKTERKRRSTKNVIFTTDNLTEEPVQIEDDRLSSGGNFSLQFLVLKDDEILYTSPPTPSFSVKPVEGNIIEKSTDGPKKVSPMLLVLFGVIPIVLILIIVTIVCIVRRQRMRRHNMSSISKKSEYEPMLTTQLPMEKCEPYYTASCHPPLSISNLPNVYETLASNDFEGLIKEFESIDMCSMYTYNHGNAPENAMKNRVSDILPYDYNRVKLESGPGSDYINASYIDGYAQKRAYIATQGPIAEAFVAFWRMVWEQRTATIVMVTRLVEDQHILKCHQYWPSRGTQQRFGELTISALDEVSLPDFTVRKFSLQQQSQLREVIQFQFTAWPDHGVPTYATATLAFLRKVQLTNPDNAGPVVVHCSAGVGRTGTFIVVDTMLRRIAHERDVDVYGCVSLLRSQRMQMVQTWEQYKFIYTALLEAIHCGNTEMRPSDITNRLESMSVIDSENNSSGMEIEFKRLTIHYKYSPNLFTSANLPVNHCKNRYANVLPFESTRVRLQPVAGRDGSDYINGSYITGYQSRNAYIATQGPLEETVLDFWRMMWEQNVNTIVMLTQVVECGRPGLSKCHEYWPSDKPLVLSSMFIISHRQTSETHSFTRRELVLTNTSTSEERVIQQYHFDTWPEQGLPATSAILGLVFQVQNNQRVQEHAPVVVHCSAGGGRTGVFIAISTAIERYQQEKLIDIFDLVKNLRNQRPAMVQTLEQYRFIYQVMAEFVESQVDNLGYY